MINATMIKPLTNSTRPRGASTDTMSIWANITGADGNFSLSEFNKKSSEASIFYKGKNSFKPSSLSDLRAQERG